MSTATAGLAEVYVMRQIYKEKMKKMEKTQAHQNKNIDDDTGNAQKAKKNKNQAGGLFSGVFKKVHPGPGPAAGSSTKSSDVRP